MAKMGIKKFSDLIGRTESLSFNKTLTSWKTKGLNFKNIFYSPVTKNRKQVYNTKFQEHGLIDVLDTKFIKEFKNKFLKNKKLVMNYNIYNTDRSAGAMFSGYLAKIYGHEGLKENSITINLRWYGRTIFWSFQQLWYYF